MWNGLIIKKPELAELEKQFIELENKLNAVIDQRATLINNMKHNEGITKLVHEINSEINAAEEKYELIGHLADITQRRDYRLTFERFVYSHLTLMILMRLIDHDKRRLPTFPGKRTGQKVISKAGWNCSYLINILVKTDM